MKIGIISNSELSIPLLYHLYVNNIEVVFYLGRFSLENKNINSLISFCKTNNISIEEERNKEQLYPWIIKHEPDYTFIFNYNSLIEVERLGKSKHRIFNIHTGTLPEFRGSLPVFWQLKNGVENLGLTIHIVTGKIDAGPVIWKKEIKNETHFTYGSVNFLFSNLLIEGVNYIISSSNIEKLLADAIPQDENISSSYKKPTLKNVVIVWKSMSAAQITDLIRACNPWNNGAITIYKNMQLKIIDAEKTNGTWHNKLPGTIVDNKDGIKVICADNSVLKINYLNIDGIFVPARFAAKFGFIDGGVFETPGV